MATVKLTPRSGQITGTHVDMPLVVIPSELANFGSLTLAEAQSVRVYTDSSLVTEIPREVVSADEIHTKVPLLSSSSELYFDYDGVRADYAVTDTYGRNAVWGDYVGVWHLGEEVNNTSHGYADSSGKNHGTGNSMSLPEVVAPTGRGQHFDGINDYIAVANSPSINSPNTNNNFTLSAWVRKNIIGGTPQDYIFGKAGNTYNILHGYTADLFEGYSAGSDPRFNVGIAANTNWNHIVAVFDSVNNLGNGYLNSSLTSSTETGDLPTANNKEFIIGGTKSTVGSFLNGFNGKISEIRVRSDVLPTNWITTEYNNQNDNAAFWEATAVGPSPTPVTKNAIFAFGGM